MIVWPSVAIEQFDYHSIYRLFTIKLLYYSVYSRGQWPNIERSKLDLKWQPVQGQNYANRDSNHRSASIGSAIYSMYRAIWCTPIQQRPSMIMKFCAFLCARFQVGTSNSHRTTFRVPFRPINSVMNWWIPIRRLLQGLLGSLVRREVLFSTSQCRQTLLAWFWNAATTNLAAN